MPYFGELKIFAAATPPPGWSPCDGTVLNVSGNEILAQLLVGSLFGVGSLTQFALPDYRGRTLIGYVPGANQYGGNETVTLSVSNLPVHSHAAGTHATALTPAPAAAVLAGGGANAYTAPPGNSTLDAGSISPAGSGNPHSNLQPYLALNILICTGGGEFPS